MVTCAAANVPIRHSAKAIANNVVKYPLGPVPIREDILDPPGLKLCRKHNDEVDRLHETRGAPLYHINIGYCLVALQACIPAAWRDSHCRLARFRQPLRLRRTSSTNP